MTAAAAADGGPIVEQRSFPRRLIGGIVRYIAGILLCLTPMTALIVLGWLTRKTARDVQMRLADGKPDRWPNFLLAGSNASGRKWSRWIGGLFTNLRAGATAWLAVLALTLPFSLVWLGGWFAGWENSFSKGYELAGVWPIVSLLAVVLSLPVLSLVPMAIAHQAVTGTFVSALDMRRIATLARAAGWRYLVLTLLIAIGGIGVFGARALPVFAEQISTRVASGNPEAIAAYAGQFKLAMTALLFTGLLVIRNMMARTYAHAVRRTEAERTTGWFGTVIIFLLIAAIWLDFVFQIYVAQFLNYSWWSWLNQPVTMLPWLGILR